MPWELTVVAGLESPDQLPLGTGSEVREHISAVIPEVEWQHELSTLGKMKLIPNNPLLPLFESWPEETRAALSRPIIKGLLVADDFSLEIYGCDSDSVDSFSIWVRGTGNPIGLLASLCRTNGWRLIDDGTQATVDFNQVSAQGWEDFTNWRDRALDTLKTPPADGVPAAD